MKTLSQIKPERSQKAKMERRLSIRRRKLMLVMLDQRNGQSAGGLIYDLSADGMFIVSKTRPNVNKRIEVMLSAVNNKPVRIPGLVVHRRNHGFGVTFLQLDRATRALVEKHCA